MTMLNIDLRMLMNVVIFATENCSYRKNLSRELDDIGVDYKVLYCDDEPEMVKLSLGKNLQRRN